MVATEEASSPEGSVSEDGPFKTPAGVRHGGSICPGEELRLHIVGDLFSSFFLMKM